MINTYTSCRTCGELLGVTEWSDHTHDTCKPTTEQTLAAQYCAAIHADDTQAKQRIEAQLDAIETRESTRDLGTAALWYATRWGWPVFPLVPGDKRPLTRHGFKDASTEPALIRRWWGDCPQANIGVPTGHTFDVLDIDWRNKHGQQSGAEKSWPGIRDSGELPDIHGVAVTARAGLHILFQPQGGWNQANDVLPGLDYRGLGGYVVVAPSRTPTGRWSWAVRPSPVLTGGTNPNPVLDRAVG